MSATACTVVPGAKVPTGWQLLLLSDANNDEGGPGSESNNAKSPSTSHHGSRCSKMDSCGEVEAPVVPPPLSSDVDATIVLVELLVLILGLT